MEEWKQVPDFPGYEASSLGRVKGPRGIKTGCAKNKGYLRTSIRKNGQRIETSLHRLVALAFHPKIEGKEFVNHINGIRHDNRPENLEWVNRSENMIHGAVVLGRADMVITVEEAKIIKTAFSWGFSVKEIAKARQLKRCTVSDITSGRTWTTI